MFTTTESLALLTTPPAVGVSDKLIVVAVVTLIDAPTDALIVVPAVFDAAADAIAGEIITPVNINADAARRIVLRCIFFMFVVVFFVFRVVSMHNYLCTESICQ